MPMNARPPARPAKPPRSGGIQRGDRNIPVCSTPTAYAVSAYTSAERPSGVARNRS